jgi:hypothetical protein
VGATLFLSIPSIFVVQQSDIISSQIRCRWTHFLLTTRLSRRTRRERRLLIEEVLQEVDAADLGGGAEEVSEAGEEEEAVAVEGDSKRLGCSLWYRVVMMVNGIRLGDYSGILTNERRSGSILMMHVIRMAKTIRRYG